MYANSSKHEKYKMLNHSSNEVVSLFILEDELYFWATTFEVYRIIFLVFLSTEIITGGVL